MIAFLFCLLGTFFGVAVFMLVMVSLYESWRPLPDISGKTNQKELHSAMNKTVLLAATIAMICFLIHWFS